MPLSGQHEPARPRRGIEVTTLSYSSQTASLSLYCRQYRTHPGTVDICPDLSSTKAQTAARAAASFERSTHAAPTTQVAFGGSRWAGCATPATGGRSPNGNSQAEGAADGYDQKIAAPTV